MLAADRDLGLEPDPLHRRDGDDPLALADRVGEEAAQLLVLLRAGIEQRGFEQHGPRGRVAGIEQLELEFDRHLFVLDDEAQRIDTDVEPRAKPGRDDARGMLGWGCGLGAATGGAGGRLRGRAWQPASARAPAQRRSRIRAGAGVRLARPVAPEAGTRRRHRARARRAATATAPACARAASVAAGASGAGLENRARQREGSAQRRSLTPPSSVELKVAAPTRLRRVAAVRGGAARRSRFALPWRWTVQARRRRTDRRSPARCARARSPPARSASGPGE